MVGRGAQREEMLWVKIRDFRCSYLVQQVFKFLLHNSHDFFMFYGYHITINRETSDIDAAYKIFFIILELISDYQLSSLFQIIILSKKSTRRGAFFHVFFSKRIHDKFHFAFMSAVSGTCFQLEKAYGEQDFSQSSGNRKNSPMNS